MRSAPLLPLALLAGCAGPSLLLLPDEHGGSGAVAVLESKGRPQETVVGQANSRTSLGGRPRTRAVDPATLSPDERALVDALPEPPARFTLYFLNDSTDLAPTSQPQLDALLAEVARRPGAEVQVTGHTDTIGDADYNDGLSLRRAEEIRTLLIARGLPADLTSAVGRGERELLEQTADEVSNRANRRVEVIVR